MAACLESAVRFRVTAVSFVAVTATLVSGCACGLPTDVSNLPPIQGTEPLQLRITHGPEIARHPDPDSALLMVSVTGPDSTPHRKWQPTRIRVSSDRGYDRELLAVPFTCIDLNDSGLPFPYNFTWRSCNHIVVEAPAVLSSQQLDQLAAATTGELVNTHILRTISGASYIFQVPVGRAATIEAARRARLFGFVSSADRLSRDPVCVRSDVLPPPPCPPWFLVVVIPFSYSSMSLDSVPVRSGGWVKATYRDTEGMERVVVYSVP